MFIFKREWRAEMRATGFRFLVVQSSPQKSLFVLQRRRAFGTRAGAAFKKYYHLNRQAVTGTA